MVVKSKQGLGRLAVDTAAKNLLKYILDICSSDKKFHPSDDLNYCWLGNSMRSAASDALAYIRVANSKKDNPGERFAYQDKAFSELITLRTYSQIAYENHVLKSNQIKRIDALSIETERLLAAWSKSTKAAL